MEGLERLEGLTELGGPSLFEVVGAERLAAAAAAALDHVLRVWGIRASSSFWWVRSCREEVIGIMRLLMERQSMEGRDASAGEGFFGLIREQVGGQAPSARQKRLSLIFLVALPYLQAKIDSITRRSEDDELEEASMPAGNFEPPVEGRLWAQAIGLPAAGNAWRPPSSPAWTWLDWARAVWPWTQALKEGCVLAYQMGYLFGKTPFSSPWLHILGLKLRRMSSEDFIRLEQMLKSARAAQFAWANKHAMPIRLLLRALFKFWHFANDNFKFLLLLLAFVVKLADWWYTNEEVRDETAYIPPPPIRPRPADDGLKLVSSREHCTICNQVRKNPAAATSGYVFCYPCIFKYAEEHSCCPITRLPCSVQDIRRLYESA
uniref:Peroxisome assembly protein 12 n=1 Tax=Hanusia phi TaxID=3032 RepID=A0A7S0E525_9CRYP|mmetsp:Transcript_15494/g.35476  ORF Transcript_15494/g.35476 Transcript_15494/m.35476 type:complete len:376 (+) Transcript_15494:164-1291(+)